MTHYRYATHQFYVEQQGISITVYNTGMSVSIRSNFEDFRSGIESAMESRRHCALSISRTQLISKWTALKTILATGVAGFGRLIIGGQYLPAKYDIISGAAAPGCLDFMPRWFALVSIRHTILNAVSLRRYICASRLRDYYFAEYRAGLLSRISQLESHGDAAGRNHIVSRNWH